MILIYESTETNFDSLGLGSLTPSKCLVTEELNGGYSLSLSHPIDEDGKWEKIQQDRIVKVPTQDGDQLFRLYRPAKNSKTGMVDVSALHIFYDLNDNLLEDVRPTVKDGQDAGDIILGGCQHTTPFSFSSDIAASSTAYYIRKNPVEAFIGDIDQSFINRWGGEIRRDNHNIEINQRRGADTGMKIEYRKNLVGVEMTSDTSQVVTRVLPTALDENGVVFYTDQKYYDSDYINNYPHPKYGVLDTGIRVGQEVDGSVPYPTIASAKTAMAELAQAYFDEGADKPEVSVSVSYVNLGDTDEYAAYREVITKANMGDDVMLEHPELGIDVKLRVVSIEWDAANDRISSIVLGSQLPNYANTAVSRDIDLSALKSSAPTNLQEGEIYNGCTIRHEDGYVTVATISEHTITTKQNSQTGFAIYDGTTLIGGVVVQDGKVLLKGNATETTAVISGKTVKIKVDPTDGLGIYEGSTFIGGIRVIGGKVVNVSNLLTDVNGKVYAEIGTTTDGKGVIVYNKDYSTTNPVLSLLVGGSGSGGITTALGDEIALNGDVSFWAINNILRLSMLADDSHLASASDQNAIGADNNGPYYIKDGTRVNF